jgi:alpha/beta hydrolase fold
MQTLEVSAIVGEMLPAHLQVARTGSNDSDSEDERYNIPRRLRQPQSVPASLRFMQQPPLGLTGVLCDSHTIQVPSRGVLHYTVFRPRNLKDDMPPPLVCVAGGPLMPSFYLSPIVHEITDRSIVLYNPIGVGQSKAISGINSTDMGGMVRDFHALVSCLAVSRFHLLGHSFGGILVYEYLCFCLNLVQDEQEQLLNENSASSSLQPVKECLSVTLSSTPVCVAATMARCAELQEDIRTELGETAAGDETALQEVFAARHECRIQPIPLPLQQSYQMAGFYSSPKGLVAVKDYRAVQHIRRDNLPAALLLQGQHDFVNSTFDWGHELFPRSQTMTLAGCSHYGMLEDEAMYGSVVGIFLKDHDPLQDEFIILPNGVKVRR